jgi:hypothetical protein
MLDTEVIIVLMHLYEVHFHKDNRGADLISDVLPIGRPWYAEPNAISNAIGYAQLTADPRTP